MLGSASLEWTDLHGLDLPNVLVDVYDLSVLIGQDIPQADTVLDYCWGDNPINQPYAMKTPFGWCVARPTNKAKDDSKPIAPSVFEFDSTEDKTALDMHQQEEMF